MFSKFFLLELTLPFTMGASGSVDLGYHMLVDILVQHSENNYQSKFVLTICGTLIT